MDQETSNKPNLSLIFSLLSLIGVVILFILYFTTGKSSTAAKGDLPEAAIAPLTGNTVAFIHTDSILKNYELVKDFADKLEQKTKKYEETIVNKQSEFEKEAAYFQESVKKNALSEKSANEIYQTLMQKQQAIMEMKDKYQRELADDELQINALLVDTVTNFLKRYNKNLNYDYILGYNKNGNIFLTNDTFNITNRVIFELNKEYKLRNPAPAK
jgi:outer membrane protein